MMMDTMDEIDVLRAQLAYLDQNIQGFDPTEAWVPYFCETTAAEFKQLASEPTNIVGGNAVIRPFKRNAQVPKHTSKSKFLAQYGRRDEPTTAAKSTPVDEFSRRAIQSVKDLHGKGFVHNHINRDAFDENGDLHTSPRYTLYFKTDHAPNKLPKALDPMVKDRVVAALGSLDAYINTARRQAIADLNNKTVAQKFNQLSLKKGQFWDWINLGHVVLDDKVRKMITDFSREFQPEQRRDKR